MKYCPHCQANVEGLIHHCDCCGELLEPREKHFFCCGIYELPQCLGFSDLTHEMIDALQPADPKRYESFLEKVGISMICYPEWILTDGNIKNRLYYSPKKKYAGLTITVNYQEFIRANREERASLVAKAIHQGIHLLQTRLRKCKLSIDDIVRQADAVLNPYMN